MISNKIAVAFTYLRVIMEFLTLCDKTKNAGVASMSVRCHIDFVSLLGMNANGNTHRFILFFYLLFFFFFLILGSSALILSHNLTSSSDKMTPHQSLSTLSLFSAALVKIAKSNLSTL